MKKRILFVITILCFHLTQAQINFSQRLKPTSSDAYVDNYQPNSNYPDEIDYCSGQWTIGGVPAAYRTFFKFDLSTIPAGSVINSALLNLYYADTNSFGNAPHQSLTNSNASLLQRVTGTWAENSITWNNQPSVTALDGDTLVESIAPDQDYLNINVAAMVQAMVDSGNNGFSLRLVVEMEYARLFFASGDNPDSANRPMLEITYTPPVICLNQTLNSKSDDITIDDYAPTNNNPDEIEYFCGGWTISGTPVRWRNLFKFNLNSIPSTATVQSASLSLYFPVQNNFFATDTSLTHPNTSILYRVTSPWNENSVTWNSAPSYLTNNSVTIGPTIVSNQDFVNIDVTALVQDMVSDPNNSYGFQLQMIDETQYARLLFASGDNPDIIKHPKLEVCYTETVGVDQVEDNYSVSVYPNPASGLFHVIVKSDIELKQYRLFDMCGKLIEMHLVEKESEFIIDVSRFSNGIYFLSLEGNNVKLNKSIVVQN